MAAVAETVYTLWSTRCSHSPLRLQCGCYQYLSTVNWNSQMNGMLAAAAVDVAGNLQDAVAAVSIDGGDRDMNWTMYHFQDVCYRNDAVDSSYGMG